MPKEMRCPNCGAATIENDGRFICTNVGCGGSFTFKAGEAHLVDIGEFDAIKGKVAKLEADNAELRKLFEAGKPIPDAAFAAAEVAEAEI